MGAVANIDVRSYVVEMEENNANVRKMVLDSYQDMKDGKESSGDGIAVVHGVKKYNC